jgi:predicted anti-sigma-YlaC factor YlaD
VKINWKQKLTSRKFWAAVTGFVTAILVAFKVDELTIEQVVSVISASAILIAYIIGEGMVDVARTGSQSDEKEGE